MLTEIKNRGTRDVCIVICHGLKGLPDAITTVWDRAIVQTCVIHLLRNIFRYTLRKCWDQIAKEIRPVYTAPTEAAAKERFVEFTATWVSWTGMRGVVTLAAAAAIPVLTVDGRLESRL